MDKLDFLKKLNMNRSVRYETNPYWAYTEYGIVGAGTTRPILSTFFEDLQNIVAPLFNKIYQTKRTEAQVLIVTEDDYKKLSPNIITLTQDFDETIWYNQVLLHIIMLPQTNTISRTIIDEQLWEHEIIQKGIVPFARVHSHHILNAYQSPIDWQYLNSGTLEIVIGCVDTIHPEIAYWLDERGQNTKDHVFKTKNNGKTTQRIEHRDMYARATRPTLTKQEREQQSKRLKEQFAIFTEQTSQLQEGVQALQEHVTKPKEEPTQEKLVQGKLTQL